MKVDFKILPLDSALFGELSRDDELLEPSWIKADAIHIHNAKPGCFNCSVVRA